MSAQKAQLLSKWIVRRLSPAAHATVKMIAFQAIFSFGWRAISVPTIGEAMLTFVGTRSNHVPCPSYWMLLA